MSLDGRRGRLGPAAARALLEALRGREPAAVRAAREASPTSTRPSSGCSSRPGCATARGDEVGHAVGRQPPARQHRHRPARRARPCCCSTSRRRRSTRASASVLWAFVDRPRRRRHRGRLRDAQRRRGRALRRPRARARRRRAAVLRQPARARARPSAAPRAPDFEAAFVALPARARPLSVRWLLLKDLQILRRSPLLVALLVALPGRRRRCWSASRSRPGPSKPKVAFANLVPADKSEVALGGRRVDASQYADKLFEKVDPIRVEDARGGDRRRCESGEALGALVVPADVDREAAGHARAERRRAADGRGLLQRREPAQAPVRRGHDRRDAGRGQRRDLGRGAQASRRKYLDVIVRGRRGRAAARRRGRHPRPAARADDHRRARSRRLPEDAPERAALEQVSRFAGLAADNLDLSEADPRLDQQAGAGQADRRRRLRRVARARSPPRSR